MNALKYKNKEAENKERKLTGYDLFMQKKYGDYLAKNTVQDTKDNTLECQNAKKIAKSIREKIKNMSLRVDSNSYKEELITKLKSTSDAPSYCQQNIAEEKAAKSKKQNGKKLSKAGKIFILVYVIITISLASTLLWVNMDGRTVLDANASASSAYQRTENIAPLAQHEEAERTNWFDRLCDSLNKT